MEKIIQEYHRVQPFSVGRGIFKNFQKGGRAWQDFIC